MTYDWGQGKGKVNQLIAEGYFPSSSQTRRQAVGIYGSYSGATRPSSPEDGFGWVTLHIGSGGRISSGGAWRSKGASWAAKQSKPFASNIVIWNVEQMMAHMKRYWTRYTEEERADIDKALGGYGIRNQSLADARRSSPFVQWADRADPSAPVVAGPEDGGPVHHAILNDEGFNGWLTVAQEAAPT